MESLKDRRERLDKEQEEATRIKHLKSKFKRKVRSDIIASGIQSVRYKLDYIKSNPSSSIDSDLPYNLILECYDESIEQFLKLKL
jgi:hypothetical protein|tara:strand:- start:2314 stop:2568 length:255 start_codon:yes stop_codon:yes gene_type:complete